MRLHLSTACVLTATLAMPAAQVATSSAPVQASLLDGLAWRLVGPFDGGPVASVAGVPGVPGVYTLTTSSGGAWKTADGGETWAPVDAVSVPAATPSWIDPANPRRIVRAEGQGISVSLDAGETWTNWRNQPIAEVDRVTAVGGDPYWLVATERGGRATAVPSRDGMAGERPDVSAPGRSGLPGDNPAALLPFHGGVGVKFIQDPVQPSLRFEGTAVGVNVSFDAGASWTSLQLNLPRGEIHDLAIHGNDLIAATYGHSVWVLDDITPLRQIAAATPASSAVLFTPAAAAVQGAGANIDFYLRDQPKGEVRLEILDAAGRVVHALSSATPRQDDPWLPIAQPLPIAPGGHRVVWDLRMDAPPAPGHRYARLAPALAGDTVSEPLGPIVLPGAYQVRLVIGGVARVKPLVVRDGTGALRTPAAVEARRRRFDLALSIAGDLRASHAAFLQLRFLRSQVTPLLDSSDETIAQMAADLDAKLADLDGSDWSLVLPDADSEVVYFEDKDTDEDPAEKAVPVALTKDYDDPTMVVGRTYENVAHAPALAIMSAALTSVLTRTNAGTAVPNAAERDGYARDHQTLVGVLASWAAVARDDVARLNQELVKRKLRALIIGTPAPGVIRK